MKKRAPITEYCVLIQDLLFNQGRILNVDPFFRNTSQPAFNALYLGLKIFHINETTFLIAIKGRCLHEPNQFSKIKVSGRS